MQTTKQALLLLLLAGMVLGCASGQKEILDKDYLSMTDQELINYYDTVSNELARCQSEPTRTYVGIGSGFWLSHLGAFLGLSKGVGGCNPAQLSDRRREVAAELNRRGLRP